MADNSETEKAFPTRLDGLDVGPAYQLRATPAPGQQLRSPEELATELARIHEEYLAVVAKNRAKEEGEATKAEEAKKA